MFLNLCYTIIIVVNSNEILHYKSHYNIFAYYLICTFMLFIFIQMDYTSCTLIPVKLVSLLVQFLLLFTLILTMSCTLHNLVILRSLSRHFSLPLMSSNHSPIPLLFWEPPEVIAFIFNSCSKWDFGYP